MCDVTKLSVSRNLWRIPDTGRHQALKGSAGRMCYDIRCCYTPNKPSITGKKLLHAHLTLKQAFIMCKLKRWGVEGVSGTVFYNLKFPGCLESLGFSIGSGRLRGVTWLHQTETDTNKPPFWLAYTARVLLGTQVLSLQEFMGLSPLALIPSAFRDGGQFWDVSVAVQILGSSPGHDPLQPSVVRFAAFRGGVVWQTQGYALTPKQELAVPNLEPKHSSSVWILDRRQERHTRTFKKTPSSLMGCCTGFKMVPVNSSLFTGHKVNRSQG